MKVTPQKQTLLLAHERGTPAAAHPPPSAADDAVLERLTIIAGRPNETMIYVQADYGLKTDSSSGLLIRSGLATRAPTAAVPRFAALDEASVTSSLAVPQRSAGGAALIRGLSLYASTQGLHGSSVPGMYLDVHA